ncbi:hypothetical protein AURDEDRAFT_111172 [Auricularia subglabra TFB-10046 SS5]|nr:hypothetical protein AURDEDRAFT_111172 [Auricularia subglabra TFB-10046 SS5]
MAPSRRSARRPTHAHNASASNSKSSHSPQAEDRESPEPAATAATASAGNKGGKGAGKPRRVKEEPNDSLNGDADPPARGGKRGGKGKAAKDKEREREKEKERTPADEPEAAPEDEDEDDSETRCPCGHSGSFPPAWLVALSARPDPDVSFMIQCDRCRVWQHGVCVGILCEEEAPKDSYFCEECRPDLHPDIPALSEANGKRKRGQRHTSAMPPPITVPSGTRSPRSHSPTASNKPKSPKRRNTMNSRDAAYDEELKKMFPLEESDAQVVIEEIVIGGRKKRKRSSAGGEGEPGPITAKRPRSTSSASDVPMAVAAKEPTPAPSANGAASAKAKPVALPKDPPPPPPPPPAPSRPNKKRNAPKKNQEKEQSVDANGDPGKRHANQYTYRGKPDTDRRRADKGDAGYQPTAAARRKAAANEGRSAKADKKEVGSPAPQSASWALPDYLQHLAHILPGDTPAPLDVREGGEGVEQERSVRVKWPGKRMTIGDMNKRVRNIVEYVAREQAAAEQRRRRVDALVEARAANRAAGVTAASLARAEKDQPTVLDEDAMDVQEDGAQDDGGIWDAPVGPEERSPTTERLMSDLMTELLAFQEKFVTKNTASAASRARREAAVVAADRNGAAAAAAAAAA